MLACFFSIRYVIYHFSDDTLCTWGSVHGDGSPNLFRYLDKFSVTCGNYRQ